MAPTLRIELNQNSRKALVASKTDAICVLQLWKRGRLQDQFDQEELEDLWEQKHLAEYVSTHLQGGDVSQHLSRCSYVRLRSHLLHFIRLRDKPFVLIERDSAFEEVNGVPQFRDTYLGATAWTALCKHGATILDHFSSPAKWS